MTTNSMTQPGYHHEPDPPAVYIETYGCQMNKLDTEHVRSILTAGGLSVTHDITTADVILLNTCGVRENAEQRIFGRLGELHALKVSRPGIIFGIIGCMAQRIGKALVNRDVRVVVGPDAYRELPGLIRRAALRPVIDVRLDQGETYEGISPFRESPKSAWVAVMRGCNNFCSYCIVPFTRGRERSVTASRIIAEIEGLVSGGWREVTLLGQNVAAYRDGETDFAGLLRQVAKTGMPWVRFLTSHPKDLSDEILEVMAAHGNVCNHLHLPLQSGSDEVLGAMNRGYTVDRYRSVIDRARSLVPGISITTDLLFGFPGESEADFQTTLRVMENIRFDFAFLYRYSERTGTRAAGLAGAVPGEIRIARLSEAIALQNAISREKNRERIGTETVVLVKDRSKDGRGWYGFSEANIPVVLTSPEKPVDIGSFVTVTVESTTGASLVGTVK
ncbi:tRNA (N6-isopentenyl adenosine(37)-C2)-methylthiotransferase MiaB [Candidatus Latescibacterota bacterium]